MDDTTMNYAYSSNANAYIAPLPIPNTYKLTQSNIIGKNYLISM